MMTTETPPVIRTYWRCQNCRRTLAEVVGAQLVIIIHRQRLYLSAHQWAAQNCPHCGTLNERDGRPESERRETA